ncbi:MAG TPA: ribose-5-phosphate isomerase RpiA [Stellaceae bacterium]|jgi:ribose 5-phosphate isomerase A|nr:ribose-5-phosphate isomerase RpiA [Stellaceae bacterium]
MVADPRDSAKRAAAMAASALIEDGMTLGLGSGTTAMLLLVALARRIRGEGLRVTGVPTSHRTAAEAVRLGIPLVDLTADVRIDLAIDGADEIALGSLALIKGLGGALLREKIVACAARRLVIIADDSKKVEMLGGIAPVPVEVVSFGHEVTARRLGEMGGKPQLRRDQDGAPFISDGGNILYDCAGFAPIRDPAGLQAWLAATVGVIESGLFVGLAAEAYVADASGGVQILRPER